MNGSTKDILKWEKKRCGNYNTDRYNNGEQENES